MPAGCKECSPGEWQCGQDTSELCAGSGGWTPAGALCLQFFVRKHPKSKKCQVKIEVKPQAECSSATIVVDPGILTTAVKKAKAATRKKR